MKKLLLIFFVLLLALLVYLGFNSLKLGDLIKQQIEIQTSELAGQKVKVDSVDVNLLSGSIDVRQITLANQPKYKYPNALAIKNINLRLSPLSLMNEPKVITNISMQGAKLWVSLKSDGSFNIQSFKKNIDRKLAKSLEKPKLSETYDPHIKVERVAFKDIEVLLDLSVIGQQPKSITLSSLVINDIGGAKGLPASKIHGLILQGLLEQVLIDIKKRQKTLLKNKLENNLKQILKEKVNRFFKN